MEGYKMVEVNEEILEQFRKVREEYYKDNPEIRAFHMTDSDLCYLALYSITNLMQDEINEAASSEMEAFCNPYF